MVVRCGGVENLGGMLEATGEMLRLLGLFFLIDRIDLVSWLFAYFACERVLFDVVFVVVVVVAACSFVFLGLHSGEQTWQ